MTSPHRNPSEGGFPPAPLERVLGARWIFVGEYPEAFVGWLNRFAAQHEQMRIRGYVLDLSQGRLLAELHLSQLSAEAQDDIAVLLAPREDEAAIHAFYRLIRDCNPTTADNSPLERAFSKKDLPGLADVCRNWVGEKSAEPIIIIFPAPSKQGEIEMRAAAKGEAPSHPERDFAPLPMAGGKLYCTCTLSPQRKGEYWLEFTLRNARVPVADVEIVARAESAGAAVSERVVLERVTLIREDTGDPDVLQGHALLKEGQIRAMLHSGEEYGIWIEPVVSDLAG